MRPTRCRSCRALIYWLRHPVTRKLAPIDYEPSPKGNVALNEADDTYMILTGPSLDDARAEGMALRTNHFVTCPQAKDWTLGGARR